MQAAFPYVIAAFLENTLNTEGTKAREEGRMDEPENADLFSLLPDELFLYIFSWVVSTACCDGVGSVCRKWRLLWNCDSLWIPFLIDRFPCLKEKR